MLFNVLMYSSNVSKSKNLNEYIEKRSMLCKECKKTVRGSGAVYCSEECKSKSHHRKKLDNFKKASNELVGIEGKDFVTCLWCSMRVKRVYGIHMKNHHPGKSSTDYLNEFPGSLLTCSSDKQNTSINSGLHMKEDKYRKMVSDKVKGEKNPNHKSKTNLTTRRSRSPFSQEFISYEKEDDKSAAVRRFAKKALKDRLTETQLEYWIKKFDGDIEKAKKEYRERQRTFTIEKCIQKYGDKEGLKVWKERQTGWLVKLYENFVKEGDGRSYQSTWAKKLIKKICEKINVHAPIKEKWISSEKRELRCSYDFTYKKKIIEFNGDFWHANPKFFKPDEVIPVLNISAQEKWKFDEKKKKLAEANGYSVLIVWESEYHKDPDETIEKCIKFLYD